MSPSDWAAWVQAVGSLLGLGIAIWVPSHLQKKTDAYRDDDRRRKGHAVAVLLRDVVEEWYSRHDSALVIPPQDYANGGAVSLVANSIERKQPFTVPGMILSNIRELEYLDKAGELLLQCVFKNYELKQLFTRLERRARDGPVGSEKVEVLSRNFFPEFARQILRFQEVMTLIVDRFDECPCDHDRRKE